MLYHIRGKTLLGSSHPQCSLKVLISKFQNVPGKAPLMEFTFSDICSLKGIFSVELSASLYNVLWNIAEDIPHGGKHAKSRIKKLDQSPLIFNFMLKIVSQCSNIFLSDLEYLYPGRINYLTCGRLKQCYFHF